MKRTLAINMKDELLDLVDENGNVVGRATRLISKKLRGKLTKKK